jgi:hypothetical protein
VVACHLCVSRQQGTQFPSGAVGTIDTIVKTEISTDYMTYISLSEYKKLYVERHSQFIVVTAMMLCLHFLPINTRDSRLKTRVLQEDNVLIMVT